MTQGKHSVLFEQAELDVSKKSSRAALSGVDLFNSTYEFLTAKLSTPVTDLDFEMRKYISFLPLIKVNPPGSFVAAPNSAATFRFKSGGETYIAELTEGQTKATKSYNFKESDIAEKCTLSGKEMLFDGPAQHSKIQILATMSKTLVGKLNLSNPQDIVLTRVRLLSYDPYPANLTCTVKFKFENMHEFNISQVREGGKSVGTLYWKL